MHMVTDVADFVMSCPLFSHHDHHIDFQEFERIRDSIDFRDLLGYATADLITAAGPRSRDAPQEGAGSESWVIENWPAIRTTGYGRAVDLGCRELFDMQFSPEHFAEITQELRRTVSGKTAHEVYDYFVRDRAANRWVIQDGNFHPGRERSVGLDTHPNYYRFAMRQDGLLSISDQGPIDALQRATGIEILDLVDLVDAMNASIDVFMSSGKLAAIKTGMAYRRNIAVSDPTFNDAERVFKVIRDRKSAYGGVQQNSAAVNAAEARPLADYLFHRLIQRANDEDLPVQIHTGYLAGHWGALAGTRALDLLPVFDRYRRVRFDIFHASWPWTSELGAIAKNYPNVYPDMCWMWTMNPVQSERTLSEWLDCVPFTKIFGYGADTNHPWCNVGYSIQARMGTARVLENKVRAGHFSPSTAREVAAAIMLENGERFYNITIGEYRS